MPFVPKTHALAKAEFATLRIRLLKIGARIRETAHRVRIALPPHASFEQTKNLFLALARGDSDRGAILAQLYKQLAA